MGDEGSRGIGGAGDGGEVGESVDRCSMRRVVKNHCWTEEVEPGNFVRKCEKTEQLLRKCAGRSDCLRPFFFLFGFYLSFLFLLFSACVRFFSCFSPVRVFFLPLFFLKCFSYDLVPTGRCYKRRRGVLLFRWVTELQFSSLNSR